MSEANEAQATLEVTDRHPVIKKVLSWYEEEPGVDTIPGFIRDNFLAYYTVRSIQEKTSISPKQEVLAAARELILETAKLAEETTLERAAGGIFSGDYRMADDLGMEAKTLSLLAFGALNESDELFSASSPVLYRIRQGNNNLAYLVGKRLNSPQE